MKRMHVHVGVSDLDASIRFYSALFGAAPSVTKPDYAKWMLEDPRVNFAISTRAARSGLDHLGIQAESGEELSEVATRLASAGRPVLDQGTTSCCYARSTKQWVTDPSGIAWEAFHTVGESTDYGMPFSAESDTPPAGGACCGPEDSPAENLMQIQPGRRERFI